MRLLNLTARNFRGFGSAGAPIALDADLVLMYGPNGFGKTSLAEAIEWLVYGTTRRRQRGDTYSKNEFDGCFPNAHKGLPVEVSATIRTPAWQHTLTRRIPDPRNDTVSETFIDGEKAPFALLGITSQLMAINPIVAQHDLQSFIHSRPKERRDIVSTALGLDELTALKTSIDGARKSFNLSPPAGVKDARAKLQPLGNALFGIHETRLVGLRWRKPAVEVQLAADTNALIAAGQRLAGSEAADINRLLEHLRVRRQQLSRTVFDTANLTTTPDFMAAIKRISTEGEGVTTHCTTLAGLLAKAIAASASAYAAALLQFRETGLKLAPEGTTCPMCEENTLTAQKRETLQARLRTAQAALTMSKEITSAIATATTAVTRTRQAIEYATVRGLDEKQRTLLTTLFAKEPKQLATFLSAHDAMRGEVDTAATATKALEEFLRAVPQRLADSQAAEKLIDDSAAVPKRFTDATAALQSSLTAYSVAWVTFEPVLAIEIASNAAIAQIDAVGKALAAESELRILSAYDSVASISLAVMKNAEAFLQKKQAELLSSRSHTIKGIYDSLNPGAQVGFDVMEPGNEQLRLHATSFGIRMSAAANLSECQLNCLGLSFWIGQATSPSSPFGFVLLDDPVQSMDDDHCESFISTVVPSLCDVHKRQVILLSHEKKLIDRLRDLNKSRDSLIYHYDLYDIPGPSITEQINLAVMLAEVKGLARGNEANRKEALDKLRNLCEQFIRDLHLHKTKNPAPAKYDNATPGVLLELFRTIPDTTPDEHRRLKDTIDFSAPANHQPVGYSVPTTPNIVTHVQRIETFLKSYKLIH
ncbi:AAA family ATPase [Nitrosospira sp. NRS527]|uniref:AAA family ATPase n=1 Tax=Nitrosospira sp. NRS527 TaxID=155925 RepID=UPI001AF90049|nr:AAA family ATPase [Nitrosospira sp. NRS527]BCT69569.1 DNA replication and repair protein RecF [Nitrosospira sp. NRS527]